MKLYITVFVSIFLFSSCFKEEEPIKPQTEADIIKYLNDNNLEATKTATGLYYIIDNEGTGKRPTSTSIVTVTYKGSLLNGTVFENNPGGITIGLNRVIPGWTEGIQLFKEGGSGTLIIPYSLGYGLYSQGKIPGGSVLVFDINLVQVN